MPARQTETNMVWHLQEKNATRCQHAAAPAQHHIRLPQMFQNVAHDQAIERLWRGVALDRLYRNRKTETLARIRGCRAVNFDAFGSSHISLNMAQEKTIVAADVEQRSNVLVGGTKTVPALAEESFEDGLVAVIECRKAPIFYRVRSLGSIRTARRIAKEFFGYRLLDGFEKDQATRVTTRQIVSRAPAIGGTIRVGATCRAMNLHAEGSR